MRAQIPIYKNFSLWIILNLSILALLIIPRENSTVSYQRFPQENPWLSRNIFQDFQLLLSDSSWSEIIDLKIEKMVAEIKAMPATSTWPEIHGNAKKAKVPVIMYHDILEKKEVFFDLTPEELAADFALIKAEGMNPISMDQLINHLRTGEPLPEKPILLTFDDGYGGHYQYVYPLLKQYGYQAVFSIYTNKMKGKTTRSSITWSQLKEMAKDPLVTIASHSISHPLDLRTLSDAELVQEIVMSKQILEQELGIQIRYFTYPVGKSDERVREEVAKAGYEAALSMDEQLEQFAGESPDLLTIGRFGQGSLRRIIPQAWEGPPLPREDGGFNFTTRVVKQEYWSEEVGLILISGGKPTTIHADSRYQVSEIIANTPEAIAAVDGAFFSLEYLDSNTLIGPVLSKEGKSFVSGNKSENPLLDGRPLVLIGPNQVKFIPFAHQLHNTISGIKEEMASVTDAFVGAGWLVKNGQPQALESFGDLFDVNEPRHRAFWGINQGGQPVIGVSTTRVGSVKLGEILAQLGMRDIVMLDSGASTSLAFEGQSLVGYIPRPVPHVVALVKPELQNTGFFETMLTYVKMQ
ncbi:polysaccharide deacetylase family protein [Gloeocapsa sp. PCC 73106]|uniref:polysaccharide deacetylase family protein n=1 Tax=Gloeocapsa sp. PCC 73106 TaxID=102232 RepID=UPI0002AC7B2C|nr:polysaccharide deacetylase family protein [Gloeocapsa sp. PCC 73106]ELR96992.1 putative xylanase/chitin deacetylase [Gloeocapsa sp. PCC 73106]